MSRVLIAGGGGFGLEIYSYLTADCRSHESVKMPTIGILNDDSDCEVLKKMPQAQYFGTILDYKPEMDDAVVIAIGNVAARRKIADLLRLRGVSLLTYVHPTALISHNATICQGAIIGPHSIVNADAYVGENVAVNVFCSIGHGARIGAHSVLSPYCSLSGDSVLGDRGFMGTRATLFPKIVLGSDCVVDAHSAVKQSVPDKKIISTRGAYLVLDNRAGPRS